ncbi:MAG: cation:proton antiporter, partial [Oscillospiraceae bacterium]|nr:cation:proton antiporter [Oscillospiraceae bacterium]
AYDDIVALLAYSIAISIAIASTTGAAVGFGSIVLPILKNLGVLALGGVWGLFMKLLIQKKRSTDNRLIISLALILSFCGICSAMDISPLLGCMAMGTVYINTSGDEKLFMQLNYFSPPILLLFFVRSGASFDLNALIKPSGAIGGVPLLLIGVLYFFVRIIGKYVGAFLGCLVTKKPKETRNYFGLALIPQAGVAIGLAAIGARALGGEMGVALETIILASSVLYELVGPGCAKLSLYLSKSYSTKLEEIVPLEETTEDTRPNMVEQLIERIQIIQQELKAETESAEERAFTEAAQTHIEAMSLQHARFLSGGRRK